MFRIEQIDHVAITVRDLNSSVAWYRDVLGLERRYQEAWGDYPAMMFAGSTGIAIFPAEAGPAPSPDVQRTAVMRHLAFRVDNSNFERARAELSARGIHYNFQDHDISHSIYFNDPDGYELELTTYDVPKK